MIAKIKEKLLRYAVAVQEADWGSFLIKVLVVVLLFSGVILIFDIDIGKINIYPIFK
jgi:hypothetical protein